MKLVLVWGVGREVSGHCSRNEHQVIISSLYFSLASSYFAEVAPSVHCKFEKVLACVPTHHQSKATVRYMGIIGISKFLLIGLVLAVIVESCAVYALKCAL